MSKSKFFIGQPIFGQLLQLIPRKIVARAAQQTKADRYYKHFTTYTHLVTMLYAVFNHCDSLREVTTGLLAWEHRLQHLGIKNFPRRSTLSDANQRRQAQVFEQIHLHLLSRYSNILSDSRSGSRDQQRLYILDSTTITLFEEVLKGAGMRGFNGRRKGGIKVHTLLSSSMDVPARIEFSASCKSDSAYLKTVQLPQGSILVFDRGYNDYHTFNRLAKEGITWITRLRKDSVYKVIKEREVRQDQRQKGVLSDQQIILGHGRTKRAAKVNARLICYQDPDSKKQLQFLSNNKRMAPATVAALYKNRWQIEVLFKRLKQNYPLKYFLGDSTNAIQIQIWCSLIADMLVKIIKKSTARRWSFSNMVSMIRIHLMTYIDLPRFLKYPEKALLQNSNKSNHLNQKLSLFPT